MKLPTGPMIVSSSTNCSTTKIAAIRPIQRGRRFCRAAHTTGPAIRMAATVSNGPHGSDVGEGAGGGRLEHRGMQRQSRGEPHLHTDLRDEHRRADGEDVAHRAVQPVTGVTEDHDGGQHRQSGQQGLQTDHPRRGP